MRHPTHPQHDGLRWDFATPLPSGDDFANYVSTQKPELFSVTNTVLLVLDLKGDETPWNPDDTKSGACTWILKGLRREGAITLSGAATFRRIAPQTELILQ